jgi:hypothetical protein
MIVILMHYHGLTLQEAVDYVGNLCEETINAFIENKKRIPSWGPESMIWLRYMSKACKTGLLGTFIFSVYIFNFLVGSFGSSLHWSFQTHRYFGSEGQNVKKHRIVKLLPLRD